MDAHLLYLDDSGTKEYAPGERYGDWNTRYFVFAGPLMLRSEAKRLTESIRRVKLQTFRTENVEVKSNWLRIERERERRYLQKFGLSEVELERFIDTFYGLVLEANLVLLAGVVDKVHMRERYGTRAWYPPAAAYEVVLQRAQQEVSDGAISIILDDMTGATPKGNQYRDNLRRHHQQLKKTGSTLWKGINFPRLDTLRFVDSKHSNLIQAADIVAYNVFRQFRHYGEEWESAGLRTLPTYDWFLKLAGKFRQGPDGRIQGYGVVKIPLKTRVPWQVGD